MRCFDAAAGRFGWSDRDPRPGSMRDGDWLIGQGCAAAAYPANIGAGAARVSLGTGGHAAVQIAAHDIGTGTHTIIAQVAAERLGVPLGHVMVQIGDTDLPPARPGGRAPRHGSGVCHAVAPACEALRERLARAATQSNAGPFAGGDPAVLLLQDGHAVRSGRPIGAPGRRGGPHQRRRGRSLCRERPQGPAGGFRRQALCRPDVDLARHPAHRLTRPTPSERSSWRCGCMPARGRCGSAGPWARSPPGASSTRARRTASSWAA